MDWKPIETAPKEEARILVAYDNGNVELIENSADYDWHPYAGGNAFCDSPTHWMNVPAAPQPTDGERT